MIFLRKRNEIILTQKLSENEKVGAEVLNYFMRSIVGAGNSGNAENSHEEIKNLSYLLKRKENIDNQDI